MLLIDAPDDRERVARAKSYADRLKSTQNPAFLDTVGWVYYHNGDFETAVTYLDKASAGLPQIPAVSYHVGMAYHKKGDDTTARKHLERALKPRTNFPGADVAKATLAQLKK